MQRQILIASSLIFSGCLSDGGQVMRAQCTALAPQAPKMALSDLNLADSIVLDLVVRDFSASHPDFETFEVGNPASTCTRDPNQGAITTKFPSLTGLTVTKGLVQKKLDNEGKPVAATLGNCATSKLSEWYRNVPGTNAEIAMPLVLRRVAGTTLYSVSERYSGSARFGFAGFFPLDSLQGSTSKPNWGKQNTASWCSINEITQNPSQPNVVTYLDCQERSKSYARGKELWIWDNSPFVKSKTNITVVAGMAPSFYGTVDQPSALLTDTLLADPKDPFGRVRPYSYMHNYNFTVEGSAMIQYQGAGESFQIGGDDDLWVFLDDSLAVDLGGVHAPDSVHFDLSSYGASLKWPLGSYHRLKFFQAERQSDGSNFSLSLDLRGAKLAQANQQAVLPQGQDSSNTLSCP